MDKTSPTTRDRKRALPRKSNAPAGAVAADGQTNGLASGKSVKRADKIDKKANGSTTEVSKADNTHFDIARQSTYSALTDGFATGTDLPPREQLRQLLLTVKAVRAGDFSVRMPLGREGLISEIGEVMNDIIELNENMANEYLRVRNTVGQEGKMGDRVSLGTVKGSWATSVNSVNLLIGDLVQPTTEIARVITSVASGDLSQKMSLDIDGRGLKGEFLRIGTTVNSMVDQLNSFAAEVTRVAKEVGTEGRLGGQADVRGASGVWRDITDNVNSLASNLTNQVRNIAKVTTAVAKGDLSQKITVDAKGEIYELKNTINVMVD
ncbi:MAG: HAMP domain-containing protein, partial [Bdellovibrionota bacterium]